jgi:hypothetical protein
MTRACRSRRAARSTSRKGQWHGFENPDSTLDLVWIVTPPGLEAFFREIGNPPGSPPKTLTREQFREIGQKHGTIFKG